MCELVSGRECHSVHSDRGSIWLKLAAAQCFESRHLKDGDGMAPKQYKDPFSGPIVGLTASTLQVLLMRH